MAPPNKPSSGRQLVIPAGDSRIEPAFLLSERQSLESWLDFHRATLAVKCSGLSVEQLRQRSTPPSTMSLLGLVRHMADVERHWFQRVLDGRDAPPIHWSETAPDGDFDGLEDADLASAQRDVTTWEQQIALSREIATGRSLDDTGVHLGEKVPLRWILTHMAAEYARHNGHADLLRERIDGTVGE